MATHQPQSGGAPSTHGHPGPSPTDEGSPNPPESSKESTTSAYRRASRKGAVKKFSCSFPGCDKLYSRAEHLHRHQLNHAPKEIFRCEEPGCDQKFVRADLLARHKKRHFTSSYIPRNRTFSFKSSHPELAATSSAPAPNTTSTAGAVPRTQFPSHTSSGPHDAAILLTPDSEPAPRLAQASSWPPSQPTMHGLDMNMGSKTAYYGREAVTMAAESSTMLPFDNGFQADGHLSENFAMWLFDAQAGWNELNAVANMPKQPKYEASITRIVQESGGDVPGLSLDMMRHCLHTYWADVSPRLPIVHQPTFSCNRCPIFLVMVMLALGAASLRARDTTSTYVEYGGFADVIISSVRWEIVTAEDANPPVALWVAQALLLLEYYETLFSFRKFHERAHIYHSATLTLLRRGSPLIGKAGSESPPEEAPPSGENDGSSDSRTWWVRWAETQSMHRVVFGAFMMDIIHATMFGHLADMAPDEIRLPLPCDDSLWAAPNPDSFRSVDSTWRMYGIKQISFLEGLKSALHCNPVKTHSFGRMIIMCGLLSVGWHLSHRDSQIKWLDRPTRTSEHDTWRRTILKAFDIWKESYDADIGLSETNLGESHGSANGPVQSPSVLYHFAHIALQVDIVTCQVFAGAKRLVNRKISTRDYSNAVARG
ncbi:Zinc finger protein klf1 like [Verticillium longisporum]|uniref:Zinc finger protein klf1 like n=1 Tax=Verticillium longisporum TaxID=100787 RepID=A0A8I3ATW1_VERLO|nr:Zinc finger protein klf1 like [Verticillium longisporum]